MPRYNIKLKPGDKYTVVTIEVESIQSPFIYEIRTPKPRLAKEVALAKHNTIQSTIYDNPYIGDYSTITSVKTLKAYQISDEDFLENVWKWYPNEYMDKWEPEMSTTKLASLLRKEPFLYFLSLRANLTTQ